MTEIQGKSILVRVSARFNCQRGFELSGVDCNLSRFPLQNCLSITVLVHGFSSVVNPNPCVELWAPGSSRFFQKFSKASGFHGYFKSADLNNGWYKEGKFQTCPQVELKRFLAREARAAVFFFCFPRKSERESGSSGNKKGRTLRKSRDNHVFTPSYWAPVRNQTLRVLVSGSWMGWVLKYEEETK